MLFTLYGIPTCGTVRKARSFLQNAGVSHDFVDFRQTPPSRAQVESWVAAFGARALRNTSGGSYRALGTEKDSWSEEEWTVAYTRDPMLLKRPVVERDGSPLTVGFDAGTWTVLLGNPKG